MRAATKADPRLTDAIREAARRANMTGERQRIYYAYSSYCVRAAHLPYQGETVQLVTPRKGPS